MPLFVSLALSYFFGGVFCVISFMKKTWVYFMSSVPFSSLVPFHCVARPHSLPLSSDCQVDGNQVTTAATALVRTLSIIKNNIYNS